VFSFLFVGLCSPEDRKVSAERLRKCPLVCIVELKQAVHTTLQYFQKPRHSHVLL